MSISFNEFAGCYYSTVTFFLKRENLGIRDPHLVTPRFSVERIQIKDAFFAGISNSSWLIILSLWCTQNISWDCRCCCAGLSGCCWHWVQQQHRDTGQWPNCLSGNTGCGLPGHQEQVSKPRALLGITSPYHNPDDPVSEGLRQGYADSLISQK